MIKIGEIIGKFTVTKINGLSYGIIDKELNDFVGFEMPLIVKKRDLEKLKIQEEAKKKGKK